MLASASRVHKIRVPAQNTRRNLPRNVSRKRGESNFLRAFERAYFARVVGPGVSAGEFALNRYGVADLIWIAWTASDCADEFSALSIKEQLCRQQLFAFEAKLKDWGKALHQAFRYRYFADKAIVVIPAENAGPAIAQLESFRHLQIGLWTFDASMDLIHEHFTPTRVKALNSTARLKAISLISSKVNLCKLREQFDSCQK